MDLLLLNPVLRDIQEQVATIEVVVADLIVIHADWCEAPAAMTARSTVEVIRRIDPVERAKKKRSTSTRINKIMEARLSQIHKHGLHMFTSASVSALLRTPLRDDLPVLVRKPRVAPTPTNPATLEGSAPGTGLFQCVAFCQRPCMCQSTRRACPLTPLHIPSSILSCASGRKQTLPQAFQQQSPPIRAGSGGATSCHGHARGRAHGQRSRPWRRPPTATKLPTEATTGTCASKARATYSHSTHRNTRDCARCNTAHVPTYHGSSR